MEEDFIQMADRIEGKAWNSLFLSNHDQPRSVSWFGNDSEQYREISAKMLGTCLHMMQERHMFIRGRTWYV